MDLSDFFETVPAALSVQLAPFTQEDLFPDLPVGSAWELELPSVTDEPTLPQAVAIVRQVFSQG